MYKYRRVFSHIWEYINDDRIIILNGARQTGKTTLMKMITEKLIFKKQISEKQILWFDLERTEDLDKWKTQLDALNYIPVKDTATNYYLFVDEFQRSPQIGSTFKVIHDHYPHIKIIATGSASWYLNIDESMAGRKIVIPIWPLDFGEFLDWGNETAIRQYIKLLSENKNLSNRLIQVVNQKMLEYLTYGAYPKVHTLSDTKQKQQILSELINSYLTRDIQLWNYKANSLQVRKLLTLLASQTGNLLNKQHFSINTELNRVALDNRLELLQNTFILHLTSPYFANKIKELIQSKKIYLVDTGLRNSLLNNFSLIPQSPDFGRLIENFVVIELLKTIAINERVFFWRTRQKQEVDIIIQRENKLIPASES